VFWVLLLWWEWLLLGELAGKCSEDMEWRKVLGDGILMIPLLRVAMRYE
jgi:hypothetical protein